jgi:hypothetical protein
MANKDKKIEINPGILAKIESEKNFFVEFVFIIDFVF